MRTNPRSMHASSRQRPVLRMHEQVDIPAADEGGRRGAAATPSGPMRLRNAGPAPRRPGWRCSGIRCRSWARIWVEAGRRVQPPGPDHRPSSPNDTRRLAADPSSDRRGRRPSDGDASEGHAAYGMVTSRRSHEALNGAAGPCDVAMTPMASGFEPSSHEAGIVRSRRKRRRSRSSCCRRPTSTPVRTSSLPCSP